MYKHNSMNRHDRRTSSTTTCSTTKMLCLLAAALCANSNSNSNSNSHHGVAAFVANNSPSSTSIKAPILTLEIATMIPDLEATESMADRMMTVVAEAVAVPKNSPTVTKMIQVVAVPQSPSSSSSGTATSINRNIPLVNIDTTTSTQRTTSTPSNVPVTTTTSMEIPRTQQQQQQPPVLLPPSLILDEAEVQRRKLEWAGRYTSVEALRETFGTNSNKLWGDLQANTARRLYKTLLPRALLDLSQLGVGQLQPQDLAPLAYQARVAAKLYARERCTVPARIAATLFDGFRQYLKYGRFQAHGMTYDQIWSKYSEKLLQELPPQTAADGSRTGRPNTNTNEEDVCLKILERSCVSNSGVDQLVRVNDPATAERMSPTQQQLLDGIHAQLEQDLYQLLLPNDAVVQRSSRTTASTGTTGTASSSSEQPRTDRPWSKRNHVLTLRLLAKQRRIEQQRRQEQQHQQQQQQQVDAVVAADTSTSSLRP